MAICGFRCIPAVRCWSGWTIIIRTTSTGLARLVAAGRIEIVGGAYYEPILTMIPSRDRIGQIARYTQWLESRLDAHVQGMWMPERVWEQSLTSDLVEAGIKYTILDDFHFRNAGLTTDQLHGYYLTEDDGRLLSVFPGQ